MDTQTNLTWNGVEQKTSSNWIYSFLEKNSKSRGLLSCVLLAATFVLAVFKAQKESLAASPDLFLSSYTFRPLSFDQLPSHKKNLSNRWDNVTGFTPLPNWSVDSQFAVFSNVTIPREVRFPLDHPEVCKDDVTGLIMVHTAGSNFLQRERMRKTSAVPSNWRLLFAVGHPMLYNDQKPKKVTLCKAGDPCTPDSYTERKMQEEDSMYGDLIMGNYYDLYQNLTLKITSIWKWAISRCPQAKFVFKVDDHYDINFPVLDKVVQSWIQQNMTEGIWAGVGMTYVALRQASHNKVSFEEYPGYKFTEYLSGVHYAFSMDVARLFAEMTSRIAFLPVEDCNVGLFGHFAGLKIFNTFFKLDKVPFPCNLAFYSIEDGDEQNVLNQWRNNCSLVEHA